ncbi:MAG: amidohydrolase family protein [Acidimicrobiia bacterium]|nr:amidohydrolase family protein [Acidimicrobiia bacterium]
MTAWTVRIAVTVIALATVDVTPGSSQQGARGPGAPVLYEGARLILGDDRPAIDSGAFVVSDGRITAIGRRGEVAAPAGANRVDLTGKTVMPALVNIHAHFGYEQYLTAAGESRSENFTAGNLRDHLERQAFFGVGSVLDAGSGALQVTQPFQADQAAGEYPSTARLSLMGGVVPVNGGPDHILIKGTRPLKANYEVTLSGEGRAAIQDLHKKGVKHVKIWLGDRGGTYPAMPHEVYDAVIDEAHKVGIKVHAHATNVRDQKDALKARVDLLVHTVQNAPLDDELVHLIREKRPYYTTVFGLGDRSEVCDQNPFTMQVLSASIIADILATDCKPSPNAAKREEQLRQNFAKMIASGARLVLGTDAGVWPRYSFGSADHHELQRYVELGVPPAQAIIAATSRPAEAIGLTDVGILAVGKRADFLVLDANPLESIKNTRTLSRVYLGGAQLNRDALLTQWKPAGKTAARP